MIYLGSHDWHLPGCFTDEPFAEQFLIIDEPSSKENGSITGHGYRVIIVPTAAVGASALKRTYPKIISFMLPDSKSGSDFKGKIGEAADDPQETYRSLITRVFNEQLAPFNKSVIDASAAAAADEDSDARLVCDAVLKQSKDEGSKEDVKGETFPGLASLHNCFNPRLSILAACRCPPSLHTTNLACFCRTTLLPGDWRPVPFTDDCSLLDI